MAKTESSQMPSDFAAWYSEATMGDGSSKAPARWAAVAKLLTSPQSALVEALLRLALGSRQTPSEEAVRPIVEALAAADASFKASENRRDLQVISAIVLAMLYRQPGNSAIAAALATSTAFLFGARRAELPMDLRGLAERALVEVGDVVRNRPTLSAIPSSEIKLDFEKAAAKVKEQPDWNGVASAFQLAAAAAKVSISELSSRNAMLVTSLTRYLEAQDEELQIMWWLTGSMSSDLKLPFGALTVAKVLVLSKELADQTTILPGPASIPAVLARAGVSEKGRVTLPAAVNACPIDWLESLVGTKPLSIVTLPIHFAISRKIETRDEEAWIAGWAAAAEVARDAEFSEVELATLFYRERLLVGVE
jgi:hypothetical protein